MRSTCIHFPRKYLVRLLSNARLGLMLVVATTSCQSGSTKRLGERIRSFPLRIWIRGYGLHHSIDDYELGWLVRRPKAARSLLGLILGYHYIVSGDKYISPALRVCFGAYVLACPGISQSLVWMGFLF